MKKKILAMALVVVLLLTAIGGTLAYFTDTDSADNQFTVGNVDIRLNENQGDSDWEGTKDYMDWLEDQLIVPGETLDKIVTVENLDTEDAWVRVTIVVPADMTATVPAMPAGWTKIEALPGVYMFMGRLNAGTETTALLQSIKLNEDVTNEGKIEAYHIPVLAEAVQVTGFENDMYGALETLATSNVKNYIDQYVANDAFAALKSGDIVTLAAGTELPQNLNNGVVLIGENLMGETSSPAEVVLPAHSETGNYTIITSGSTFVNLHFTERLFVIGDATFVGCTFDNGLWMSGVTGNVSIVGSTFKHSAAFNGIQIDNAADGGNGGVTNHGRVIVKSCTIDDSVAVSGATSVLYDNCTFGNYDRGWAQIRLYCPTTLKSCTYVDATEPSIGNSGNYALRIIP